MPQVATLTSRYTTLILCGRCGDLVPAEHAGQYESTDYCRPCLVVTARDDLMLLALELAS